MTACKPDIPDTDVKSAEALAVRFAEAVAKRDNATAYGMTSEAYRSQLPFKEFQRRSELMLPPDFGSPVTVNLIEAHDMRKAATYQAGDIRWAYVGIRSPDTPAAVTVIVTKDGGAFRVRHVEWGR